MRRLVPWLCSLAVACSVLSDLDALEGTNGGAAGADASAGSGGTGGSANACEATCTRMATAGCKSAPIDECMAFCLSQTSALSKDCLDEWGALLICAAEGGFYVCDALGAPQLLNCTTEQESFASCLPDASGSGGTGGSIAGGGTGGTGGASASGGAGGSTGCTAPVQPMTCPGGSATDPCQDCLLQSCCAEMKACSESAECMGFAECANDYCSSAPTQACLEQFCGDCDAGMAVYVPYSTCAQVSCSAACGID